MPIIDSIRVSGTTYQLQGGSGGSPTVELTQAEYDALVSAGTVSADTYYIITDATPVDMSNYYTSAQTDSAITSAVSGKQDTLVSGTNIKTINNESLLGSGNIDIQGGSSITTTSAITSASTGSEVLSAKDFWDRYADMIAVRGGYIDGRYIESFERLRGSIGFSLGDFKGYSSNLILAYVSDGLSISGTGYLKVNFGDISSAATDTQVPSAKAVYDVLDDKLDTSAYTPSVTYSAGTNIDITNDTINCTLPIKIFDGLYNGEYRPGVITISGTSNTIQTSTSPYYNNFVFGEQNRFYRPLNSYATYSNFVFGYNNQLTYGTLNSSFNSNIIFGSNNNINSDKNIGNVVFGTQCTATTNAEYSTTFGKNNSSKNEIEFSVGKYNNSVTGSTTFGHSGNTLFSVGNGTSTSARHNAFEIRQNGDIYCSDGTNDVKLQDTITATAANTTALGGLSLVKLTQAEYDALTTKDSNTLYIIIEN